MNYLVCYSFTAAAGKSGTGDICLTATALTTATVSDMRDFICQHLRKDKVRNPSVCFSSITKLDPLLALPWSEGSAQPLPQ